MCLVELLRQTGFPSWVAQHFPEPGSNRFDANALYFHLCVTAYNLFVLLRHSLPCEWHTCRTPTMRWRVYALAAKVVCHARRVYLKFSPEQATLMKTLLAALATPVRPPPLPNAPWRRCQVPCVLPPRTPGDRFPCPCYWLGPVNLPLVIPIRPGRETKPSLSGQIIVYSYTIGIMYRQNLS